MNEIKEYKPLELDYNVHTAVENLKTAYWSNEPEKVATAFKEAENIIISAICHHNYTVCKELQEVETERPQGEWEESHIISCGNILRMGMNVIEHKCKNCGRWSIKWVRTIPDNFCSNCGVRMKGGAKND